MNLDSKAIQTAPADAVLLRLRQALALMLWEMEAVRVRPDEPFQLASGNLSPIYVNGRRVISDPAFMQLFCATSRLLLERRGVAFDAVAGGETAGIPFASVLSAALGCPMAYVRKKPKGYGMGSQVEGHLEKGQRVLLVEDLITDGGSKKTFIDALEAADFAVDHCLVFFDRQQGGEARMDRWGVRLHSLADRDTTLDVGVEAGYLDTEGRASVDAYFADPRAWHQARGLEFKED